MGQEGLALWREIIESLPDAVVVLDRQANIVLLNQALACMSGHTRAALLGRSIRDLIPARFRDTHAKRWPAHVAMLEAQQSVRAGQEYWLLTADGREMPVDVSTGHQGQGETILIVATLRDATLQKAAQAAQQLAREEAEQASRAKSLFLASMSHELRTPLNAIIGFAQMLEMGVPGPTTSMQQEAIGHMLNAGRHLLGLVDEVLDLARIEAGRLVMEPRVFSLDKLIDEVVGSVRQDAAKREIHLGKVCDCEFFVHADHRRTRQVLLNLLTNAIKYNRERGTVSVACRAEGDFVRVEVTDTGHGIASEHQAELFQPFRRLGAETTAIEGTGIGLAISQRLVEAMGGKISFLSTPGIGSSFWFLLPIAGAPHERELPGCALPAAEGSGRVFYIEDSESNTSLMRHAFRKLPGLTLECLPDGETALARLSAMPHTQWPRLVMLDIKLPGMDGYAVLAALRSLPGMAQVPVIAISSAASVEAVEKGLAAGFAEYLTKPLDIARLFEAIRRLMGLGGQAGPSPA